MPCGKYVKVSLVALLHCVLCVVYCDCQCLVSHPCGYLGLLYDVASESEITPRNKIDKPLVVYRFSGNVMTSIATLRTY